MKEEPVMFKMLFREELYTLDEVREMIRKKPDLAWVVYQTKPGTHKGERTNCGTFDSVSLLTKFG